MRIFSAVTPIKSLLLLCFSAAATANDNPINPVYNLTLAQLLSIQTISIATGTTTTVNQAPAVASIITAEDIEAMGATELSQVLEQVPGLHVIPSQISRMDDTYEIRGIQGGHNPTIQLLIDGVEIKNIHSGGLPFTFKYPLTHVKQIEILRGPGSAIYGADAFSGVINIITKANESTATRAGVRYGSFNTKALWLNSHYHGEAFKLSFAFDRLKSAGDHSAIVEHDFQTTFDNIFATDASLAPTHIAKHYNIDNVHLDLEHKGLKLQNWWWTQKDGGVGPGGAQAIDHEGKQNTSVYRGILSYQWQKNQDTSYHFTGSYQRVIGDSLFTLLPPGATVPIGAQGNINFAEPVNMVTFTEGFIGRPITQDQGGNLNATLFYQGFQDHKIRANIGFTSHLARVKEFKNFGPGVLDGTQTRVDGSLTDVSYTDHAFMPTRRRDLRFLSVQDQWQIRANLDLVTGLRFDHYSDFGTTTNPRIALVWKNSQRLTTKFLYGNAFRAPTFAEQSIRNNSIYHGNLNLNPETITTYELAFNFQPSEQAYFSASIFDYRAKDMIIITNHSPDSVLSNNNAAQQKGHGFELEAQIKLTPQFTLKTNYSQQLSTNNITGTNDNAEVPYAPQNTFYLALDYRINQRFSAFIDTHHIANRPREAGSQRDPIADYWLTGLNLRFTPTQWPISASLRINNLFNSKIKEPSDGNIVYDYPMPSRQVLAQLEYKF